MLEEPARLLFSAALFGPKKLIAFDARVVTERPLFMLSSVAEPEVALEIGVIVMIGVVSVVGVGEVGLVDAGVQGEKLGRMGPRNDEENGVDDLPAKIDGTIWGLSLDVNGRKTNDDALGVLDPEVFAVMI